MLLWFVFLFLRSAMFLGIEIGGTKLQLGLGAGDGHIVKMWRGTVDPAQGGEGIRRQILTAFPELLAEAGVSKADLKGIGVGFGGPTDDDTQSVITSHQIVGWDGFPLAAWLTDLLGLPTVICNDADVAGLAEALFGAGKGLSPIFYITVGTGIGGGLIINGEIYRGVGRGAAEIGHIHVRYGHFEDFGVFAEQVVTLEDAASGMGIAKRALRALRKNEDKKSALRAGFDAADPFSRSALRDIPEGELDTRRIAQHASNGDLMASTLIRFAAYAIADGLEQATKLLCPKRYVIGGGVSLIGDQFFEWVREGYHTEEFPPFAGLTDIVPAALGEEVVVHGALALARKKLGA